MYSGMVILGTSVIGTVGFPMIRLVIDIYGGLEIRGDTEFDGVLHPVSFFLNTCSDKWIMSSKVSIFLR